MFYNNRRIIYTVLILVALSLSFFLGKKVGSVPLAAEKTKTTVATKTQENINYNNILNIKGANYSLDYSITKAFFIDRNTLNFSISIQENKNVTNIRVLPTDQENNILKITPISSSDVKTLNYSIKLEDNTSKIKIQIYPLNKEMAGNKNLNLNSVPYKSTTLDVQLIKKDQIDNLK